jgi:hypothetical protein
MPKKFLSEKSKDRTNAEDQEVDNIILRYTFKANRVRT